MARPRSAHRRDPDRAGPLARGADLARGVAISGGVAFAASIGLVGGVALARSVTPPTQGERPRTSGAWPTVDREARAAPVAERASAPPAVRFAVRFRGVTWRHPVGFVGVLPGERLDLRPISTVSGTFRVRAAGGVAERSASGAWTWTAPSRPGLYPVTVLAPDGADSITLNAFVMVPASDVRDEHLNGYRIGRYPSRPLREIYRPPVGFIEVTPENRETLVSPHFRLRQFLCKQAGGYPKYVVLDPALLVKLELLLAAANADGLRASTFFVMSGYRTPFYNRSIGNSVWSRHQWGAAADIYIDESPADGIIDDLNGDGRIDIGDADVLGDIVERLSQTDEYRGLLGGMGRYRRTSNHGPFLHIDLRGRRARW